MNRSTYEHVMLQILKDLYTDKSVAPFLGFKGGAAAYMFYELDRFVINLDFDLLDITKKEQVLEKLELVVKAYGKIKETYKKIFNSFFVFSFAEKLQNIKIEIKHQNFASHYEEKKHLDLEMLVMVKEDLCAHKLVEVYEKDGEVNCDIYDLWFFLKNRWPINKNIVDHVTTLPFQELTQKCITLLEKKGDRHILAGMGRLLDEQQKSWAKEHLRIETIALLKSIIE